MTETSVVDMSMRRKPNVELDVTEVVEQGVWISLSHIGEATRAPEDVEGGLMEYGICLLVDLMACL